MATRRCNRRRRQPVRAPAFRSEPRRSRPDLDHALARWRASSRRHRARSLGGGHMFLGIDLGTSSLKAIVLDVDGAIVGRAAASYSMSAPQPGWSESDPQDWWQAAGIAARQAAGDHAAEIAAIGLSGQMHGVVLSDDMGQPLRPAILWPDVRTRRQLDAYRELSQDMRRKLANPPATGMAGAGPPRPRRPHRPPQPAPPRAGPPKDPPRPPPLPAAAPKRQRTPPYT